MSDFDPASAKTIGCLHPSARSQLLIPYVRKPSRTVCPCAFGTRTDLLSYVSNSSYNIIGKTELEYEFLYNLMDKTLLFLRMCPENNGYAEEILTRLDEMAEIFGRRL